MHAHCYNVLRRSNFKRRCPMDNLKQRRIVRFTIDSSIVDQRVLEEGDVQKELLAIQEMQAFAVEPLCYFFHKKKWPTKLLSEDVTVAGLSITSSVHGEGIGLKRCYGYGAEVTSIANFVGRLRLGGPGEGVGNDSTLSSGLDSDVAVVEAPVVGAPDDLDAEQDLQFLLTCRRMEDGASKPDLINLRSKLEDEVKEKLERIYGVRIICNTLTLSRTIARI